MFLEVKKMGIRELFVIILLPQEYVMGKRITRNFTGSNYFH